MILSEQAELINKLNIIIFSRRIMLLTYGFFLISVKCDM